MSDDRKKPGVVFWATVGVVVVPLLYVASYGPAAWITVRAGGRIIGLHTFVAMYEPVQLASKFCSPFGNAMDSYAKIGLTAETSLTLSGGGFAFRASDWTQGVLE
jgi:hypothetical protein